MPKIQIVDAMSVIRARLEKDMGSFSLRRMLEDIDRSPDLLIYVWDGKGARKARQAIYPEYKAQRRPAQESIQNGIRIIKAAVAMTKVPQIEVPGYEADDVIARLVRRYSGSTLPIEIQTRDRDLRALCDISPRITCTVEPKAEVLDRHLQLYKTWVGDPSDNVKGVPQFGDKAWARADKAVLRNVIDNFNRGLTDFNIETDMPASCREWVYRNRVELLKMWVVVGFLPIADRVIDQFTTMGVSNPPVRDHLLNGYFL